MVAVHKVEGEVTKCKSIVPTQAKAATVEVDGKNDLEALSRNCYFKVIYEQEQWKRKAEEWGQWRKEYPKPGHDNGPQASP